MSLSVTIVARISPEILLASPAHTPVRGVPRASLAEQTRKWRRSQETTGQTEQGVLQGTCTGIYSEQGGASA